MYRCNECGAEFEKLAEATVDLEEEYGVGGSFGGHHTEIWDVCPECLSYEFEEIPDEEEEEEEEEPEEDEE